MSACAFDKLVGVILTDGIWNETFDCVEALDGTPEALPPDLRVRAVLHLQPADGQSAENPVTWFSDDDSVLITDFDGGLLQLHIDPADLTPGQHLFQIDFLYPGATLWEPAFRGVRLVQKGASIP